jgi:zinc protease
MKKILISFIAIGAALSVGAQQLDRSMKPKPGPAPEIKLGKTESFSLANGMKVFVVENHKLPVVTANIILDIKPALEGEMAGYSDLMSELLLAGTKTRSKDKLNQEIDQIGAKFSITGNSFSAQGLKKSMDKIFDLMSDIAINAVIPEDELDRTKKKVISGLQTEKNDPDAMVRNVSAVVNFGKKHPYGDVATEESINKITLERCNEFYTTYFRPNVAYMAIVGDITMDEVKLLINQYFGKWQQRAVPVAEYTIPEVSATKLTKVAFAPRSGSVQSVVSVTYPVNLKPGTEDVIKARVANTILGGGSQGRLFLDLREKHAWTYGAYSSIKDDALGGSFSATVKCRNVVSDSAVAAILDEMNLMQKEKVSDSALQNSISYLSGSFSIGIEDPNRVAQFAINIDRYNMPKDFYQNYLKNLSRVTADDVMAAAQKYFRTDHANIVVAGSKEEVANKLARFSADGKIDFYDNTGKPLVVSANKPAPAGLSGNDVFKKYIDAIGGATAINAIKDIKIVSTTSFQGRPLTSTEKKKAPNKACKALTMDANGQSMVIQKLFYNGTKGFKMQMGQPKTELTGNDLEDAIQGADINADLHPEKYGIVRTVKEIESIDGNDAYVVERVNAKGKKRTEYYDVTSGFLVKKIGNIETPNGPVPDVSEYKNYKEVPGIPNYKIPYLVSEDQGGQLFVFKVQSVDVNKGISDEDFN